MSVHLLTVTRVLLGPVQTTVIVLPGTPIVNSQLGLPPIGVTPPEVYFTVPDGVLATASVQTIIYTYKVSGQISKLRIILNIDS